MRPIIVAVVSAAVIAGGGLSSPAGAQSTLDYPVGQIQPYHQDSGMRPNPVAAARPVYEHLVHVEGSAWLRLYFGEVQLEPGSFLRITSMLDNETQELDADALAMWSNTSAYFNGPSVFVELVAAAKSRRNRVVIEQVASERAAHPVGGGGVCGICGSDDRVPASNSWAARLFPAGCTASVFDANSCMVSAGHCVGGSMVVQFNVPNSQSNCNTVNPPIADQFPVISGGSLNAGVGSDWSVLIPGTNNLGEVPYERYGELRPIAGSPGSTGQAVDIWGYGVDQTCTVSQTLRTSGGSITFVGGTWYEFFVDLTGGNSGSALIRNNEIIGIITHCSFGCPNFGTRVDRSDFTAARANCAPPEPIVNDDCADAIPFNNGLGDGAIFYTTIGANTDGPNNPSGLCDDSGETQTHHDIWHTYQATCTGTLTVTTCDDIHGLGDPTYDTDLVMYGPYQSVGDINCGNLIFAACNDDYQVLGCGNSPPWSSAINISVVAGEIYLIRTGGWSSADQGTGWLSVQCAGPAAGACCAGDGTCTVLTAANCAAAGGTYQGDGTTCAGNPCPQTTGACCLFGACSIVTEADCTLAGGSYQGDNTTCTPDPCVPAIGACCLTGGGCFDGTLDNCNAAAGVYQGDGTDCASVSCPECAVPGDCDDGDPCNGLETCVGGICQPGTPLDCDDGNACTDDFCDPGVGCVNIPSPAGSPCDDGDPCTIDDFCDGNGGCVSGTPLDCNDGDPCTADSCNAGNCTNTPITPCCGNGIAEAGEDCISCPADVQCPPGTSCDPNGQCVAPCPEDLDGDGDVDSADLTVLLGAWAAGTADGDIDGDGDTDSGDLTLLLGAWAAGGCP